MTETLSLSLHEFHEGLHAHFTSVNGAEVVADYGDASAEHSALRETVGVIDLSFRSRLCLAGADRARYLHGQVTNDVKRLHPGDGCYATLVTAKGKMQSDLNILALQDELLLDFEPGLAKTVTERLEKYVVSDDVQVVDVSSLYGLLSAQGPKADVAVRSLGLFNELPGKSFQSLKIADGTLGEIYLVNLPRLGSTGFDLYVPTPALGAVMDKLIAAAKDAGGRACGWSAFEVARIEAGIPRFGADMDESNLPLESGIETRAVSYTKGCYIGQEVINRLHTMGHVNRELHGLQLADNLSGLPVKGDKLFQADKEVGHITSATSSPTLKATIALGYVRREAATPGTELTLHTAQGKSAAKVVELPFVKP